MFSGMDRETKKLSAAFGGVLKKERTAAGLSQQELALEAGLDRTYISLLERGLRQPTLSTIFQLSRTLQVRPSELVGAVEDRIEQP